MLVHDHETGNSSWQKSDYVLVASLRKRLSLWLWSILFCFHFERRGWAHFVSSSKYFIYEKRAVRKTGNILNNQDLCVMCHQIGETYASGSTGWIHNQRPKGKFLGSVFILQVKLLYCSREPRAPEFTCSQNMRPHPGECLFTPGESWPGSARTQTFCWLSLLPRLDILLEGLDGFSFVCLFV